MKKNYYTSVLIFFLATSAFPQAQKQLPSDSLYNLYIQMDEAYMQYDYSSTIELSLKLIELAKKSGDNDYLYTGYNYLGVTYESLEDSARARENYAKALEYAHKLENDTILLGAYNNLGNVFSENEETVEKGLQYYNRAIKIGSRFDDSLQILDPVVNKGWTHLDNEQYREALPYLDRAKSILGEDPGESIQAQLLALYGKYYSGIGDFEKARSVFESSIAIAEKDSLITEASFAFEEYAKMLFRSGAYKEAYEALEKHEKYKDQVFKEEKLHQMEAAYARFGTAESHKKLELAKREQAYKDEVIAKTREISVILVVSMAIMLLFLILLFRNNRIRNKLIEQLKEKNLELVSAKEEAERLSLLKTRFFSTVSHELRTPLYGVVGLTSLLLEDNKNEKQVEDLKSLKFSADYLLALINDVLQMNKMESKLIHLEDLPFNLEELMNGIVKSFEFTRNQNNNLLELQIDEQIPRNLVGDSVRLSQVIMNLVGNAVKFTERGRIWIKADLEEDSAASCSIRFEIGDTGIGIPKNKQEEIFEEFSQLRSSNFNYQGTGLGLPIVKKLLQLFDSDISLRSGEGVGSVFSFEIAFEKGAAVEEDNSSSLGSFMGVETRRALIVDDNRINQVVTRRILEKQDFICKVASGGNEAIEILKNETPDVVLMDVNMPDISGMEATRKIREFNKVVPIIALTAVEIDEMRDELLGSGMNDIIVKPYDTHQFFNTVYRNLLTNPEQVTGAS